MALLTSSGPFLTHAANGSPTVCKSHTHNFVKRGRGLLFEHLQACKKKLETLERPHAIAILHESGFRKAASYRYLLIIVLSNTSAAYGQVWETKRLPAFSAPATWNRFKSQLKLNNSASQGFWKLHGNGFLRRWDRLRSTFSEESFNHFYLCAWCCVFQHSGTQPTWCSPPLNKEITDLSNLPRSMWAAINLNHERKFVILILLNRQE